MTVDLRSDAGELYDLEGDPQEINNLFDDPAAAAIRRALEAMLASRPADMRHEQIPVGIA